MGCARPDLPALYTRLSTFAVLIQKETDGAVAFFSGKNVVSDPSEEAEELGEGGSSGLSTLAILGIVFGAIFSAFAFALILFILHRRSEQEETEA